MVNKSFQPIQLTFTWSTGHAPKQERRLSCRVKTREPLPRAFLNGCASTGRQSWPLYPSSLICMAASCNTHSNATSGYSWEWLSGYNPFIGQTQSYGLILVIVHSPFIFQVSVAWPRRMKLVGKQESVEIWGFLKKIKIQPWVLPSWTHQFHPMVLLCFYTHGKLTAATEANSMIISRGAIVRFHSQQRL